MKYQDPMDRPKDIRLRTWTQDDLKKSRARRPHTCHVPGCFTKTRPALLMCPYHWKMVPAKLKAYVNGTYTKGQCDDRSKVTRDWVQAAREAIDSVALTE